MTTKGCRERVDVDVAVNVSSKNEDDTSGESHVNPVNSRVKGLEEHVQVAIFVSGVVRCEPLYEVRRDESPWQGEIGSSETWEYIALFNAYLFSKGANFP